MTEVRARYFILTQYVEADYYPLRRMTHSVPDSRDFKFGVVLLVILAVCALTLPLRGDRPHPRRKDEYKRQVEKLEEVWRKAQLNGDIDAMDKLLSDDYIGITMSGQVVTKMQQLERMRKRTIVLTKLEVQELKVKVIGSTAIVTSLADVEGTSEAEPMHGTFRSTRVYSRISTGFWKMTNYEATRVGSAHSKSNLTPPAAPQKPN